MLHTEIDMACCSTEPYGKYSLTCKDIGKQYPQLGEHPITEETLDIRNEVMAD